MAKQKRKPADELNRLAELLLRLSSPTYWAIPQGWLRERQVHMTGAAEFRRDITSARDGGKGPQTRRMRQLAAEHDRHTERLAKLIHDHYALFSEARLMLKRVAPDILLNLPDDDIRILESLISSRAAEKANVALDVVLEMQSATTKSKARKPGGSARPK